jgi:hypothetical protein
MAGSFTKGAIPPDPRVVLPKIEIPKIEDNIDVGSPVAGCALGNG